MWAAACRPPVERELGILGPGDRAAARPARRDQSGGGRQHRPRLDLRVLYGHSFLLEGYSAYIDAQLGYRVRFDDPPNEVRFDFTFGVPRSSA